MEETHGPLTSPREYTALPSRDGDLSLLEDGPAGSDGARTDADMLATQERGPTRAFAEEQPLLRQEVSLYTI
jgi:hypothetical protein